jgi:hypothetical protein
LPFGQESILHDPELQRQRCKNSNATISLACLENKNILFYFEKRSSSLQRWRCSSKFKSRRIGSRNQSYDPELQRQRCKDSNATISLAYFENKKFLLP